MTARTLTPAHSRKPRLELIACRSNSTPGRRRMESHETNSPEAQLEGDGPQQRSSAVTVVKRFRRQRIHSIIDRCPAPKCTRRVSSQQPVEVKRKVTMVRITYIDYIVARYHMKRCGEFIAHSIHCDQWRVTSRQRQIWPELPELGAARMRFPDQMGSRAFDELDAPDEPLPCI